MYRILVFPESPDCMMVFAEDRDVVRLPVLSPPFMKADVAKALADAGIEASVWEGHTGRWTRAQLQARAAVKSERRTLQNERAAIHAVALKGALYPEIRDRAEAMAKKQSVDAELRELKEKLAAAKRNARVNQVYLSLEEMERLTGRIAELQKESLALQAKMGELRKVEAQRNREEHQTTAERFMHVAFRVHGEDVCNRLLEEAEAEAEREENDSA
jgi:hypothetical protein